VSASNPGDTQRLVNTETDKHTHNDFSAVEKKAHQKRERECVCVLGFFFVSLLQRCSVQVFLNTQESDAFIRKQAMFERHVLLSVHV